MNIVMHVNLTLPLSPVHWRRERKYGSSNRQAEAHKFILKIITLIWFKSENLILSSSPFSLASVFCSFYRLRSFEEKKSFSSLYAVRCRHQHHQSYEALNVHRNILRCRCLCVRERNRQRNNFVFWMKWNCERKTWRQLDCVFWQRKRSEWKRANAGQTTATHMHTTLDK